MSIDDFAQSIRLKQFLNKIGLNDEQLEEFVRRLDEHCFKRGLAPTEFMNLVEKISFLSDNLGTLIEELPGLTNRLKRQRNGINLEIRDLITKKNHAISRYNITMIDLEEYRRKRPLVERLEAKLMELETERKRRVHLEGKLWEKEYEWSIYEHECIILKLLTLRLMFLFPIQSPQIE